MDLSLFLTLVLFNRVEVLMILSVIISSRCLNQLTSRKLFRFLNSLQTRTCDQENYHTQTKENQTNSRLNSESISKGSRTLLLLIKQKTSELKFPRLNFILVTLRSVWQGTAAQPKFRTYSIKQKTTENQLHRNIQRFWSEKSC